jgi:excisionase family DNA binding protein
MRKDEYFLSPKHAADQLDCSVRTIYRLIAAGVLKSVKIGGMQGLDGIEA